MKTHNYTPKVNCPACRRDVSANNDGMLDPHYDQRVGSICPGLSLIQECPRSEPQPAVKLIDALRPPWEEK